MTASARRKAILETLCARRHDTRENLAFEFCVSKRTIEYDVQALSLNYPIYTVQGKGGGIYVIDGFRQDRSYLTDKQCELLKRLSKNLIGEDFDTMQSILNVYQKPNRKNK